jgi:hypothetical protein
MVLPILGELSSAGVKDENVTVIFACGIHRAVKTEEAAMLLGDEVVRRVKVVSHDSRAPDLVDVGTTQKHGTRVLLNRAFVEADVRVLTGSHARVLTLRRWGSHTGSHITPLTSAPSSHILGMRNHLSLQSQKLS